MQQHKVRDYEHTDYLLEVGRADTMEVRRSRKAAKIHTENRDIIMGQKLKRLTASENEMHGD